MSRFVFGQASRAKLMTCDPRLRAVASRAIELTPVDFGIISGWRSEPEQNALYQARASKTPWPRSKHNATAGGLPNSHAFDFAVYVDGNRIDWQDTHMFALVAGVMMAAAKERNVPLRWGGDWNMNGSTRDQTFMDWGHIELADKPPTDA